MKNITKVNSELLSEKSTHIWRGVKVKVFYSTLYNRGYNVSAEIMEGRNKGKWTTVILDQAQPLVNTK